MAVSKAQQKSVRKYEKEHYDQILIRFPKGTKDLIKDTGKSVNGYVNDAVYEKLCHDGIISYYESSDGKAHNYKSHYEEED